MNLNDLIELANIGRRAIVEKQGRNIIGWLGNLPTDEEIDSAKKILGNELSTRFPYVDAEEEDLKTWF